MGGGRVTEQPQLQGSKSAETYAALTTRTGKGVRLADAIREYASMTGRSEPAIRASYYAQRAKLGHTGRDRERVSVEQAVSEARRLLEQALEQLDRELDDAKAELDRATERYEQALASSEAERTRLEHTLTTLTNDN
jgi:hypothetical protein